MLINNILVGDLDDGPILCVYDLVHRGDFFGLQLTQTSLKHSVLRDKDLA